MMRSYETFSTTADAGIRIRGRDFAELYGNAFRGMNVLLFGANLRSASGCAALPFHYRGDGPESVLVNFLSEVLFQVYQKGRRVAAAEIENADRRSLDAKLRLSPCRRTPRIEIKSVTYHNLRVIEGKGVLRAAIVFDV